MYFNQNMLKKHYILIINNKSDIYLLCCKSGCNFGLTKTYEKIISFYDKIALYLTVNKI
jgi:hypothetical protein